MTDNQTKVYLFVHIIWTVNNRQPLLTRPIRTVLFTHIQQHAAANGIKMLSVNGVDDHLHCLVQLLPAQNLSQVIKSLKTEAAQWINDNQLIREQVEWQEGYAAYSVSPSGLNQVIDYIKKQEEHHKTKTLDSELAMFDTIQL